MLSIIRSYCSFKEPKFNNSARFNLAIRRGDEITFHARFTHPDGHNFEIILPSCYVEESPEDGTPSAQAKESPTLHAQVAEVGIYAGHDIVYGVDLAAGGTTTLEPMTTTTAAPAATTTTA